MTPDRGSAEDCITALLHAIDARDWEGVRAALADEVHTDYKSLFGVEPSTAAADDLVAQWRGLLPGFDSTQHVTGPFRTEIHGDTARSRCAVTAVHQLGNEHWTVGGHYDIALSRTRKGWRIASITLSTAYVHGNPRLPEIAVQRAQHGKVQEPRELSPHPPSPR